MTSTTEQTTRTEAEPGPPTRPGRSGSGLPRVRARRNPVLLAAGAALVVVGAAGVAWLVTSVAGTSPVLVTTHAVPAGAVISSADLAVAQVSLDPAVATVPANQRSSVVGQRAASALPAGLLLTPASTTSAPVPAPGQTLVGVAVTPRQLPAAPLQTGDPVTVVLGGRDGDDPSPSSPTMPATVAGQTTLDDGSLVVDVTVPTSSAARLAGWVASGRALLVAEAVTP